MPPKHIQIQPPFEKINKNTTHYSHRNSHQEKNQTFWTMRFFVEPQTHALQFVWFVIITKHVSYIFCVIFWVYGLWNTHYVCIFTRTDVYYSVHRIYICLVTTNRMLYSGCKSCRANVRYLQTLHGMRISPYTTHCNLCFGVNHCLLLL